VGLSCGCARRCPAFFLSAEHECATSCAFAYCEFFAAFREAAERLRAGILPVVFPAGSFPPALPFVGG
jgi:hypothetical protein